MGKGVYFCSDFRLETKKCAKLVKPFPQFSLKNMQCQLNYEWQVFTAPNELILMTNTQPMPLLNRHNSEPNLLKTSMCEFVQGWNTQKAEGRKIIESFTISEI